MSLTTMTPLHSAGELVPAGMFALDVSVSGTLDASAVLEIREAIISYLGDGPCLVLVNVTGIDRVAASGLAGTLELLHLTRMHGGDLRPYGSSPAVAQARSAVAFGEIYRVYPSRDLALRGHVDRIADPGRARRRFGRREGRR
ncbi:STAS domain-containing protein [Raineyella sp. W15-4]|uniref:STAS domain-containing protein n=1 Tax=Raineyella sp. W15-4 TaxID=3081651 RepID=UPI002955C55B|nr:STAS domain-containing protein [Raineyella sp. W15-4]WOQ16364.1 STAS domain-containing protein [Raineyella sp. W15-4]